MNGDYLRKQRWHLLFPLMYNGMGMDSKTYQAQWQHLSKQPTVRLEVCHMIDRALFSICLDLFYLRLGY